MAQKSYVAEGRLREARQHLYTAAPALESFLSVREVIVEMRFRDPEGKVYAAAHRRIFTPEMQAFFEFQCPLRDCSGGGYSLTAPITEMLSHRRSEASGTLSCAGRRIREKSPERRCQLELQYGVTVLRKGKAA